MTTTQTYRVTGMTCDHCVSAVSSEIGELDGVTTVDVELNTSGSSAVTVTSDHPIGDDAVAAAVDEAGYTLSPA